MRDTDELERVSDVEWRIPRAGAMRVPARIYADASTIEQLVDEAGSATGWSALRQICNVASLPGIVEAAVALPDVHPGYGFPIGGVGAFDLSEGVAVVGGVGFDINCGVRLLRTPLVKDDAERLIDRLGKALFETVPAGLGSTGALRLSVKEVDALLVGGARYVTARGYGTKDDLFFVEEEGCMQGADPDAVSILAKQRQFGQVGTLGSGNHYLEVQVVEKVLDEHAARVYGLRQDAVVVSIHTGSRALGHQIGQDALRAMAGAGDKYGIRIPDPEMVCAPIASAEGRAYLAAIACGSNCAFANRQVIAHLVRRTIARVAGLAEDEIQTVCDIGHNNAKIENHRVAGGTKSLLVHRKGATRAFAAGRDEVPAAYREVGHPIVVGGSMGTASYVMRGTACGMEKAFGSGIHGAGRSLSRKKAAKRYWGDRVLEELRSRGIRVWAHSRRGIAEEAPGAYKDIERVVQAAERAGINQAVARLRPIGVIKG